MLEKLLNILKKHKGLYITGTALFLLPFIVCAILPHLSFLCVFLSLCGICCIIYAILLQLEKAKCKGVAVTATVCKITAWVLIALFLVSFAVIETKIISAIETTNESCDYILVLGCGLRGKELTRSALTRADAAVNYLNKNPECKAVLCGGQGKDELVSEAQALYDYMIECGIDKGRLLKEERSTDTTENINFAKELIPNFESLKVAVATNDFHLYRSMLIMKKAGFTKVYSINGPTPNVPFLHLSYYLREYFSVIFEYLNI